MLFKSESHSKVPHTCSVCQIRSSIPTPVSLSYKEIPFCALEFVFHLLLLTSCYMLSIGEFLYVYLCTNPVDCRMDQHFGSYLVYFSFCWEFFHEVNRNYSFVSILIVSVSFDKFNRKHCLSHNLSLEHNNLLYL